jgi:hypothetical protein
VAAVGPSQQVDLAHQDVPAQPGRKVGFRTGDPRQRLAMMRDIVLQLPDRCPLRLTVLDRIGLGRRHPGGSDDPLYLFRRRNLPGSRLLVDVEQRPVHVGTEIHRVRAGHLEAVHHRKFVAHPLPRAGGSTAVAFDLDHLCPAQIGHSVKVLPKHFAQEGAGTAAALVHHVGRSQDE